MWKRAGGILTLISLAWAVLAAAELEMYAQVVRYDLSAHASPLRGCQRTETM
jgi:hypothetical protein